MPVEAREEPPVFDARISYGHEIPWNNLTGTDNWKTLEWWVIQSREAFISALSRTCAPQITF